MQPRQQTSQRTGAVDNAGQKRTQPKARESKQGTAQPPQKSRTAGGDDRTTNQVLEASRAKKHYYTVAQRADTTPTGVPRHRVQNPVNPCELADAGEALKT